MFGTNLVARRSKPEQIADHAWEHLVSTFNSAGDSVRGAARDTARSARRGTSHLADGAGDRVNSVRDEAWRRATAASAALAGRRPGLPWLWIIGAVGVGAAIGWAAGSSCPRRDRPRGRGSEYDRERGVRRAQPAERQCPPEQLNHALRPSGRIDPR